jgi:hypothetical protein
MRKFVVALVVALAVFTYVREAPRENEPNSLQKSMANSPDELPALRIP